MTDAAARCPACAASAPYWRPDDRECEICLALAEMPDEIGELADALDNLPGILGADYGAVLRLRQIHGLLAEHVAALAAERERVPAVMSNPTFAGFRGGEDPWVTHWRWIAVRNGIVIGDLRAMHLNETKGGLPTGRCRCGLPAPCPTAERLGAYTATLWDPCGCRRHLDGHCPQSGNGSSADTAS